MNTSESKNPIHAAVLAEARQLPQHLSQPPTEVLDTRQRSKPANTESLHAAIFVGERQMSQQSVQELMMIQDTQLANRSRDKEPLSTKVPAEAPAASTKSLVDVMSNRPGNSSTPAIIDKQHMRDLRFNKSCSFLVKLSRLSLYALLTPELI